ncbi:MAG: hypothetical protein EXS14_09025 [Planctomycetes bacterium]|nr:hypothetical protein [Planctomycetota bacterium]
MKSFALGLALLLCVSCATSGDALQGADGKCVESSIVMSSSFITNSDKGAEVRRVLSRNGELSCELHTSHGDFVGTVPFKEWRKLWDLLLAEDPFGRGTLDVDDDDPSGGPYHKVRLELGAQSQEFSAQNKADLVIFATREVGRRLQLSNAIVELVARNATQPAKKQ